MAGGEESSSSEDSEDSSTSSSSESSLQASSEEATPENQDRKPSASSSQPASRRKVRAGTSAQLIGRPGSPSGVEARGNPSAKSSAKSGGQPKLPMPRLDLKALFDYNSRKRQHKYRSCESFRVRSFRSSQKAKRKSRGPRAKRPRLAASEADQKRRSKESRLHFPFVQKLYGQEHLPVRMECLFEQATMQGFFRYIEKLKFEQHLKKSLAQLDATDDLEKESLESRRHKYLDDELDEEESLSPIEDATDDEVNEDGGAEDIGARIVDNSCFILSSKIPKKMESKRKTKS